MQTVDIQLPKSSLTFQAIEKRPVPPAWVKKELANGEPVRIKTVDGARYTFTPEGSVFVDLLNGQRETYWAKPTLAWAMRHVELPCRQDAPPFFQFHSDGSVTARIFGLTYLWQEDEPKGEPVDGERENWGCPGCDCCADCCDDCCDPYDTSYDSDYSNYGDYRRGN